MNKSKIMKQAWVFAKQYANRKGGKAVEYIGAALKQAWKVAKVNYMVDNGLVGLEGNTFYLTGSKRQPLYLAVINGLNEKFGLNRKFLNAPERGTVDHEFELNENTVYNWKVDGKQFFGKFLNGRMVPMNQEQVIELF